MVTQLNEKQLKMIVRQSVKEVLDANLMRLGALFFPFVSLKEQKEIERLYKKPSRKIARSCEIKI